MPQRLARTANWVPVYQHVPGLKGGNVSISNLEGQEATAGV